MFVAKSQTGQLISVLYQSEDKLNHIRQKGPFYCPACNELVNLRMGSIKIPHFAHINKCVVKPEGESEAHLNGKRLLYNWLGNQNLHPQIECFIAKINQRADILVAWDEQLVAFEYQCSVIPVAELKRRTFQYITNGIIPMWIINDDNIMKKERNLLEFSDFLAFFLNQVFTKRPSILSLNPESGCLNVYTNILPTSPKRAYYDMQSISLQDNSNPITVKKKWNPVALNNWLYSCEKWLFHLSINPHARKNQFLHDLYRLGIHPLNLPLEVGIPLPNMYWLKTAPIEWQAYIWTYCIYDKREGHQFSLNEVERYLTHNIKVTWRSLPQLNEEMKNQTIKEYLTFLELIGRIKSTGDMYSTCNRGLPLKNHNQDRLTIRRTYLNENISRIMEIFRLTD